MNFCSSFVNPRGGGEGGGAKVGMNFGTDVRPKVQNPTPFIHMGSKKRGPNHICLLSV